MAKTMKHRNSVYIIAPLAALALLGSANDAAAQLRLPRHADDLVRLPDIDLDRRAAERIDAIGDTADEAVETVTETSDEIVDSATGLAGQVLRSFVGGIDADGRDIEEEIIVVLVNAGDADALVQTATEVISQRELPALNRTLLILRRTINLPMPDAIRTLRDSNPGASIDYNHLYRLSSDVPARAATESADPGPAAPDVDPGLPRIGMVDSAVLQQHRALQEIPVTARDFTVHDARIPLDHGTAVASLIARSADNAAALFSASVFFQLPDHAPGATAESIVAALDWLVDEDVDAINMSLAGPANDVLEAAVAALVEKNVAVVAAVGNNGPAGEPLYPAAYDGVIGVTAVDDHNRVFRYANRGSQVDYAARGVDVKVADSETGGWRVESGTSMASPHVAVVAARLLKTAGVEPDALASWLTAGAEDLGRRGFDEVFGYGLITRPPVIVSAN